MLMQVRRSIVIGSEGCSRSLVGVTAALGALLTAGYATRFARDIAASTQADQVSDEVVAQLQKSFTGAEQVAARYPQYADAITAGAKQAFLDGADWAYTAGIVAILVGAALVLLRFTARDDERRLLGEYHAQDAAAAPPAPAESPTSPASTAPTDASVPPQRAVPEGETSKPESV